MVLGLAEVPCRPEIRLNSPLRPKLSARVYGFATLSLRRNTAAKL